MVTARIRRAIAPLNYIGFAQWPSFLAFKRGKGAGTKAFNVKGVKQPMRCRAGTTDALALEYVFDRKNHLPLEGFPRNGVILDLGANAGFAAVHYATLYPGARIISVELDADNAAAARENLKTYQNCELVHAGVWYEDGEVSYGAANTDAFSIGKGEGRKARAVRIETLLDERGIDRADFVKMDIEGAEWPMFENPSWLQRINSIGVEIHDRKWTAPIMNILKDHGFTAYEAEAHWSQVNAYRA